MCKMLVCFSFEDRTFNIGELVIPDLCNKEKPIVFRLHFVTCLVLSTSEEENLCFEDYLGFLSLEYLPAFE